MSQVPDTAVVLAGGLATFHGFALAPYPKILLPLANRPLLHYQARVLAEAGVKRLVLCLNSGMGERVAERLDSLPYSLECLVKETVYGTGGSLKEVEDAIHGDAFWVLSGDLLLTADLAEMLAFHQQRRATATVGVLRGPGGALGDGKSRVRCGPEDQNHSPHPPGPGETEHAAPRRSLPVPVGGPARYPSGPLLRSQGTTLCPALSTGRAHLDLGDAGIQPQHHQYRRFLHRQPGYLERPGTDAGSGKTPKSFG